MTSFLTTSLSRRAVLHSAAVGAVGISPALRALSFRQRGAIEAEHKVGHELHLCSIAAGADVDGLAGEFGEESMALLKHRRFAADHDEHVTL